MPSSDSAPRKRAPRHDRLENYERLIAAAREVFDEEGIAAPMNNVAVRSRLSAATLYRHFATRDELIVALYDRQSDELTAAMQRVVTRARGNPFQQIKHLLEEATRVLIAHPSAPALAARGLQLFPDRVSDPGVVAELHELIAEAKRAGVLADDVTAVDLVMIPTTLAALSGYEQMGRSDVWERQLELFLRGLGPRT